MGPTCSCVSSIILREKKVCAPCSLSVDSGIIMQLSLGHFVKFRLFVYFSSSSSFNWNKQKDPSHTPREHPTIYTLDYSKPDLEIGMEKLVWFNWKITLVNNYYHLFKDPIDLIFLGWFSAMAIQPFSCNQMWSTIINTDRVDEYWIDHSWPMKVSRVHLFGVKIIQLHA